MSAPHTLRTSLHTNCSMNKIMLNTIPVYTHSHKYKNASPMSVFIMLIHGTLKSKIAHRVGCFQRDMVARTIAQAEKHRPIVCEALSLNPGTVISPRTLIDTALMHPKYYLAGLSTKLSGLHPEQSITGIEP